MQIERLKPMEIKFEGLESVFGITTDEARLLDNYVSLYNYEIHKSDNIDFWNYSLIRVDNEECLENKEVTMIELVGEFLSDIKERMKHDKSAEEILENDYTIFKKLLNKKYGYSIIDTTKKDETEKIQSLETKTSMTGDKKNDIILPQVPQDSEEEEDTIFEYKLFKDKFPIIRDMYNIVNDMLKSVYSKDSQMNGNLIKTNLLAFGITGIIDNVVLVDIFFSVSETNIKFESNTTYFRLPCIPVEVSKDGGKKFLSSYRFSICQDNEGLNTNGILKSLQNTDCDFTISEDELKCLNNYNEFYKFF